MVHLFLYIEAMLAQFIMFLFGMDVLVSFFNYLLYPESRYLYRHGDQFLSLISFPLVFVALCIFFACFTTITGSSIIVGFIN